MLTFVRLDAVILDSCTEREGVSIFSDWPSGMWLARMPVAKSRMLLVFCSASVALWVLKHIFWLISRNVGIA